MGWALKSKCQSRQRTHKFSVHGYFNFKKQASQTVIL